MEVIECEMQLSVHDTLKLVTFRCKCATHGDNFPRRLCDKWEYLSRRLVSKGFSVLQEFREVER